MKSSAPWRAVISFRVMRIYYFLIFAKDCHLQPLHTHTSHRTGLLRVNHHTKQTMSAAFATSSAMMAAPAAAARPTARHTARVAAAKAPAGLGAKAVLPTRRAGATNLGVSSKPQLAARRR